MIKWSRSAYTQNGYIELILNVPQPRGVYVSDAPGWEAIKDAVDEAAGTEVVLTEEPEVDGS